MFNRNMASAGSSLRRRHIFPHLNDDNSAKSGSAKSKGKKKRSSKSSHDAVTSTGNDEQHKNEAAAAASAAIDIQHHLLPLPLILTVLLCSGFFWIASFRDVMATGKPIFDKLFGALWGQDDADANYLQYTKSTQWYSNDRGWKSKQGGISAIMGATTDANNMGGLFLRKMAGAAALAFHTAKLWPALFSVGPAYDRPASAAAGRHRWAGASWSAGHFDPLLALGMLGDACIAAFYAGRLEALRSAGAGALGLAFAATGLAEACVLGAYLLHRRMTHRDGGTQKRGGAGAAAGGDWRDRRAEDPDSLPSRIVARTVFITSSLLACVALRDLFLPGTILPFLPRDDIYLEWTGAFLHSPPPDTVEADEHGLEAPLFEGDKFVSQLLGLYLALGCLLKMMSAVGWSKGNRSMGSSGSGGRETMVENVDRSGVVSSRIIWKAMAFGDVLLLMMLRFFTPAAMTASLDLRWHLMFVAYEAFILFLYGFW